MAKPRPPLEQLTEQQASSPFNPDVANAFFRAAYLESWGRGIDLIRNACKERGAPAPLFRWDNGLWVEFPFPPESKMETIWGTTQETSVKTSVKTSVQILQMLQATPDMTMADLATQLGKTLRAVEMACAKLTKNGKIRFVGPRKGGHWEVLK
ncbi:MAG: ATP-binding protein [bacterium]